MLRKPSPLKHLEGHAMLSKEEHEKAHVGQSFESDFEHITLDEFEIGSAKNYGIKDSGYDDVEGNIVKKLTEKYGSKGFSFEEARIGTDAVKVTSPDGTPTTITLNSSWNGFNKNPQAHQQLMAVLNSNVDPEKKKVFDKTGLNPNDNGDYDIEIEDGTEEQAYMGQVVNVPKIRKTIKADEALDIAADVEGELTKALTSVGEDGQKSTYPGLEKYSSSLSNLNSLTPDHQRAIRESVFTEFNKNRDNKISKDSFNDMWDRKLWKSVTGRLSTEFERENYLKLDSLKETVDPKIIEYEEKSRHAKLKGKELDKQKVVAKITTEEANIKNFESQIKELDPIKDKEKIASLTNQIEQANFNIKEHFKEIDNIATSTTYQPSTKFGTKITKLEETDEELASTLYNYEGMSEERAKRIKEAADDQKTTTDPELAAIKTANPKLTDKEAMKELWDLKVLRKQQLAKDSRDKFITIDPTEYSGTAFGEKDIAFKKFIRTAKENGLTNKDGKIKMSLYDFMTKFGQNHRDFDNWYNAGSGMISKEDLALIEETETTRDQIEGQLDAIYEMHFLNTDPGKMEKPSLAQTFVQAGVEAAGREWFGLTDREAQNLATIGDGPRNQIMMDKMNDVQYDINQQIADGVIDGEPLVWSKEQMDNMTRTFGEEVAEGIGNFVPMLVELGVISAASGGVGSVTGITGLMGALRAGKHGKKGKMAYHALMAGWEEAKMQAIFELPPTGGAMFYAGGAATRKLTPFKAGGRFAWMDPVFQKMIKGGVIGATSAEAAHITEMAYDDLMGHKDFKAKFDENFGDMDANLRRYAVNAIVFKLTGVTHLKKGDLKSTGQKYAAIAKFEKEKRKLLDNPEGTREELSKNIEKGLGGEGLFFYEGKPEGYENLSLKQMEKFDAISEVQGQMQQQVIRETHNAKLDPKDKNFEANYDRMVAQPMNEAIKAVVPEYKGFKVKFTENRKEFSTDDKGRDLGNEAEFRPETNEMIFDRNMYTPGKAIHEYTHAALRAYFDKNPSVETNFTKRMTEVFKDFDFKTKSGTKLGDAINEHYGIAPEKDGSLQRVEQRVKEGKKLKNEEFLAYMAEMLSDPAIYYQKVAPTIFKEAKQEITSIMEETFGLTPQIKTAGDFVRLLGRLGQDAARGLEFKNKASRLAELDKIDFLGIEYSVAREKRQNEALGSRNLELEKQALLKKPKTKETEKEIAKIDDLVEKSKINQKFTDKYKQAKEREQEAAESKIRVEKRQEELDKVKASHNKDLTVEGKELSKDKITRDYQIEQDIKKVEDRFKIPTTASSNALAVLRENNKGILTNYVGTKKNPGAYKDVAGSSLTREQFRNHVENVEFERILGTYNRRAESLKDVPFSYYLENVLKGGPGFGGGRIGNILKDMGIDMAKIARTVSRDAEGFTEKEFGETGGGSFSRETPGGSMGVELIYKLPVTQKHIDAVNAKYTEYKPKIENGKLIFKNVKDVAPALTKEMFGKGVGENALSLAEHWLTAHTANPLSYNPITATSNRVPGSILEKLYNPGKTLKSKDFGKDIEFMSPKGRKAADAGLTVQDKTSLPNPVKNSKENKNWYLEKFGIKDNRSESEIREYIKQRDILKETGDVVGLKELAKNQIGKNKLDVSGMTRNDKVTLMPKQMEIMGDAVTAQLLAARHLDLNRDVAGEVLDKARKEVHKFRAGKPKGLASKNLEGKRFEDQMKVLDAVQKPEFKALLDRNLKSPNPEKAISKTLTEYFDLYKDKDFGIGKKDLNKIGEELAKEFQYGKITPLKIATKAARAIELPNELNNIEAKYGLSELKTGTPWTYGDIVKGQARSYKIAKHLTEKHGVGAFEALMLRGESGGAGIGQAKTLKDLQAGIKNQTLRYAIFENVGAVNKMLERVYSEIATEKNITIDKLKKYEGISQRDSDVQGIKNSLLTRVLDKNGNWDLASSKKQYEFGEKNKEVLKDVVDLLADLYDKKVIDHRQVRQWVEMHAGSMQGLIKKSASLAVLPEGKKAELEKIYGKEWVLEHTTPAKYVKARIYDYILSGKNPKAKQNLDLTIKDMYTTFIPEKLDRMVNKILQENLPSNHVPGMDPLFSRYYLASHVSDFNIGLNNFITGKKYRSSGDLNVKELQQASKALREHNLNLLPKEYKALASKDINSKVQDRLKNIEEAARRGNKKKKKSRGMSTFDFDETLIIKGKNFVTARKGNESIKINSENFPLEGPKLAEQGYTFDFKDFVNVKGGVEGPLFKKLQNQIAKYGNENVYVLTARMQESAPAIHAWLKSKGVKLPIKNITGLGNSTGEAKAMWMLEKFAEGYNDMYFVDDAMPNVKAVKHVLNQLDIKSKVQQALATKNIDAQFNKILEDKTGIGAEKEYKRVTAKMEGAKKGKYKWIIPPSAADFELLTSYTFAGKGKKGETDMKFFEDNLARPFAKGINEINRAKQATAEDYLALRKQMPEARKMLSKKVPGTKFTHDAAIRVDRWTKAGHEVPGLSKKDFKILQDVMKNSPELMAYSEALGKISKQKDGWIPPTEHWLAENITADLNNINNKVNRAKYLEQWIENKNIIFSEKNLNKIEAIYGPKHRDALEDMLYRMETGSNRTMGTNALTNRFMNWTNNSVGAIMFFNMRSAALQTLSSVNYLNWKENNPLQAAKAFANQPQYWKDFSKLFNSDMLKQRRAGLKMNVNEAEIAAAVENSSNKALAGLNYLLKKGFLPTQIADSFAISSGGATFYRNRIKMYEKQGLDAKAAEKKAFTDFQEIAEKTQQSARPDLISQQQASPLGRLILAFANTPMQYARIIKKSSMDLAAGRGDAKSNVSKIAFYGGIQGMIFAGLQSGMFSMLFDDEQDEDYIDKKSERMINTMADGLLRGTGVAGASVSAIKNSVMTFMKENDKDWNADYDKVWIDLLNVSPPIGSKVRKLKSAGETYSWNKEIIPKMGFDIENPAYSAGAKVISATTNVPLDRLVTKINNIKGAMDVENEAWQRIAMMMGYNRWDLGMDKPEAIEKAKEEVKEEKAIIRKKKAEIKKEEKKKEKEEANKAEIEENKKKSKKDGVCSAISRGGKRCNNSVVAGKSFCTVHEKVKQNETGKKSQCKKIKSNGKRCGMQTSSKSGYCYYHD